MQLIPGSNRPIDTCISTGVQRGGAYGHGVSPSDGQVESRSDGQVEGTGMITSQSDPPVVQAGIECLDLSDMSVLITGSTSGIGRAAAESLGGLGAHVFVHGRDELAGEEVVSNIEAVGGTARFVPADFLEPGAVSRLAETVRNGVDTLDVLCHNAGGAFRRREPTTLGVDAAFHVNHLASFQLTAELLEVLAADCRVVSTSSVAHRIASRDLDRLLILSGLSPAGTYCRSKLANILFANELGHRFQARGQSATSNAFHPGIIPGSDFGRSLPGLSTELWQVVGHLPGTESIEDGAGTLVYLAASPDVKEVSGAYFARCKEIRPDPATMDRSLQVRLWEQSADLLEMDVPLPVDSRSE